MDDSIDHEGPGGFHADGREAMVNGPSRILVELELVRLQQKTGLRGGNRQDESLSGAQGVAFLVQRPPAVRTTLDRADRPSEAHAEVGLQVSDQTVHARTADEPRRVGESDRSVRLPDPGRPRGHDSIVHPAVRESPETFPPESEDLAAVVVTNRVLRVASATPRAGAASRPASLVDQRHVVALVGEGAGGDRTGEAGADDQHRRPSDSAANQGLVAWDVQSASVTARRSGPKRAGDRMVFRKRSIEESQAPEKAADRVRIVAVQGVLIVQADQSSRVSRPLLHSRSCLAPGHPEVVVEPATFPQEVSQIPQAVARAAAGENLPGESPSWVRHGRPGLPSPGGTAS